MDSQSEMLQLFLYLETQLKELFCYSLKLFLIAYKLYQNCVLQLRGKATVVADVPKNLMLSQGNEKWKKKAARIQEIGKLSLSCCGMSVNHEEGLGNAEWDMEL